MDRDAVRRIFLEAGASDAEIARVDRGIDLFLEGKMTSEELYYYLIGLSNELLIPLTPRQVGDLRVALGLPRSRV
jgi:hypothetical protein